MSLTLPFAKLLATLLFQPHNVNDKYGWVVAELSHYLRLENLCCAGKQPLIWSLNSNGG